MYIVRWLAGHPIVATWVLGILAVLLVFGSGDKEEVASVEPSAKSQTEVAKVTDSDNEVAVGTIRSVKKEGAIEGAIESVTEVVASDEIVKTADLIASTTTTAVMPPLKSELDNVSTSAETTSTKNTPTTDLSQITNEEMLLMAREAYWNNGLDEAAQIYNKLIEKDPKVLEYKGELGNVYWRQGYPKKAAELYSEIAIPMIEDGGSERVANMIGFIGLFYPDRASVIHDRMQSKK